MQQTGLVLIQNQEKKEDINKIKRIGKLTSKVRSLEGKKKVP